MNPDAVTRMAQSLYLSGSSDIENLYWRVDHMFMDNVEQYDNYQFSTIVWSFLRAFWGRSYGKDKHMVKLEPHIIKRMNDFSIKELSNIMVWYGLWEVGNPDLHALFLKKIEQNIDKMEW